MKYSSLMGGGLFEKNMGRDILGSWCLCEVSQNPPYLAPNEVRWYLNQLHNLQRSVQNKNVGPLLKKKIKNFEMKV